MANDFSELDFFRGSELIADPYPYYEALRQQCPVTREEPPRRHHGDRLGRGLRGAERRRDVVLVHLGDRPVSRLSGPARGLDDITELIEQHRDELPFSDQLPTLDPPTHTNHRSLLMRLITPKRLKENEDAMWALADQALDDVPGAGPRRLHQGLRRARSRCWSSPTCSACPRRIATSSSRASASTRVAASGAPARNRWRTARWNSSTASSPTTSPTAAASPATTC